MNLLELATEGAFLAGEGTTRGFIFDTIVGVAVGGRGRSLKRGSSRAGERSISREGCDGRFRSGGEGGLRLCPGSTSLSLLDGGDGGSRGEGVGWVSGMTRETLGFAPGLRGNGRGSSSNEAGGSDGSFAGDLRRLGAGPDSAAVLLVAVRLPAQSGAS